MKFKQDLNLITKQNQELVAENAVSGMLSVIRATFRQNPVLAPASGSQISIVNSQQQTSTPTTNHVRASTASKGRGLTRNSKKLIW